MVGPWRATIEMLPSIGASVTASRTSTTGGAVTGWTHPNEQWIYILEGTFEGAIEGKPFTAKPGTVVYVPANAMHSGKATKDGDVVFFTCKDASHSLHGIKAA